LLWRPEDVAAFSPMIVGWQIATHMRTEGGPRRFGDGRVPPHRDRPVDASFRCRQSIHGHPVLGPADRGEHRSFDRVGDSYDNAMAEAPNGTFKAELAAPGGLWRTRAQLETEIIDWIYWYNEQRLHKQIGDLPPTEYEQL
jgi:putative transposase